MERSSDERHAFSSLMMYRTVRVVCFSALILTFIMCFFLYFACFTFFTHSLYRSDDRKHLPAILYIYLPKYVVNKIMFCYYLPLPERCVATNAIVSKRSNDTISVLI